MRIVRYLISIDADRQKDFLVANDISLDGVIGVRGIDDKVLRDHHVIINERSGLSPGEVGCALSHIEALSRFLSTDADYAFVFEDDAKIDRLGVQLLEEQIISGEGFLAEVDFVHLGGLDGLKEKRIFDNFSKSVNSSIFRMPDFLLFHLWRTAGYCLSRRAAIHILSIQCSHLRVADSWRIFFTNTSFGCYYSKLVAHPLLLNSSVGVSLRRDRSFFLIRFAKVAYRRFVFYKDLLVVSMLVR